RRAIAVAHAAAGEALDRPRYLTTFVNDNDEAMNVLVRAAGYEFFRRFNEMVRPDFEDIAMPPLPDGLEVRPVDRDTATMRRIFDAQNEAFRDGFGWVNDSDEAFTAFLEEPHQDPALWLVAFDGDEVAGVVMPVLQAAADGSLEGWLDPVFTRRAWRRRGLARALVARSLVVLRDQRCVRACLGVDAMNPNQALDLYESSGFRVVSSATGYRRRLIDPGRAGMGVA
ncbi:MAG TPA: GNAT family N-acetyltransferase, partial [Candidatus Binatia bacterium]|nr:GNAT family N-acetyltransferase [Candidatus Binatia bacterium]